MSDKFNLGQLFYNNYDSFGDIPKGVYGEGSIVCVNGSFYIYKENNEWDEIDMVSKTPYDQLLDYLNNMEVKELQKLYEHLDILGMDIEKIILTNS